MRNAIGIMCVLFGLLLLAGCECCGADDPLVVTINPVLTAPAGMVGGAAAEWACTWTGGTAPYSVAWDFGGGAEPDNVTGTASGLSHTASVAMVNPSATEPADYTVTLSITDAQGYGGSATLDYTVAPAAVNTTTD
jgi:hypothetical protein